MATVGGCAPPVGKTLVTIEFTIDGTTETPIVFDTASTLPADVNRVLDASITSFTYTGRHDHGQLPTLKSDGYLSQLTNALQCAKAACDGFLTEKMRTSGSIMAADDGQPAELEADIAAEDVSDGQAVKKKKS
jgi:hypothetical protein